MNARHALGAPSLILTLPLVGLVFMALMSEAAEAQVAETILVGAGDITSCGHDRDESTAQLLDVIPGTVITLGDNAYPDGTLDQFNNCYGPTWGRHKDRTRPSPGNHDYHTGGAAGYYTYFGASASPLDGDCTGNCKGYYSYDVGDWHIIALNSEISMSAGSAQEQWLRADLAANPSICTLAYWHKPRFSSGQHGDNTGSQALWQALYDYGGDVVMNGHDHTYERFAPQSPSGQAEPTRGVREFVVGTGGASLYSFPTIRPNSEVRSNTTWGVLKLTLHQTSYDWEFVPIAGGTFTDSGSANCVSLGPTPSPSVTNTPESTATPSATPTPPDTSTPGPTPTPSDTPLPPTPTLTPSPTPLPTWTSPPGASPLVDSVSYGTTAGNSLTITHTTSGPDRLMLVGVSINNDNLETVTSITYSGLPLTLIGFVNHQGSGGDDSRVEIWRLVAPPTGTHDVVINFNTDLLRYAVGGVITFTGVDQLDPLGTFASSYADSTSASVAVPSASDELVLGVVACETCTSVTFSGPAAEHWSVIAGGGNTIGAGGTSDGAGPSTVISATLGKSDHWAMGGVSVKVDPAAPSLTPSLTSSPTPFPSATFTPPPSDTSTSTLTPTDTDTPTALPTPTDTSTPTSTSTPSSTPAPTDTPSPTASPSATTTSTPSDTSTSTVTPTDTDTPTALPTPTDTSTPTSTSTPSSTPAPTDTPSPTASPSATNTSTPSDTPTSTVTPTQTDTPSATPTPTDTSTPTSTPSHTSTSTDTGTPTPTSPSTITPTLSPTPPPSTLPQVDALSTGTTAGNSLTITHTTSGADRLMLVGVSINNDNLETVTSITYSGLPLTRIGFVNHQGGGGDDARVEIWRLVAPPTGAHDVVVNFNANLRRYAVGGVITFTGVDQTDPLGTFASSDGFGTSASVAVPSVSDELVLGVVACETCSSVTFSAPADQIWSVIAGGGDTIGAGGTTGGAGTDTAISAALGRRGRWAMGGVTIKSASAGIPPP